MEKKKKFSISLTTQILVATIGGLVFGVIVGPWASNIKFIGDIFLRLIQMSVVLLVMSAVAGAVGGRDGRKDGIPYIQVDYRIYNLFCGIRSRVGHACKTGYRN